ncbi:MAG: AAA family ATPase, partial [Erysipelotrichaceae bacterium]|nr:AAA family ATPase [Erysipelotrichaceae bacterium]
MFLKRIELQGFKSFATKTVIDFESQYTGIVGPNGCGKSNIVDAIKWVLGEQSAKNMRGTSMSDVVFAGAEGKKGVNMAEVTLVFDNSGHFLNTDFEEVEITRRLYKNTNESEYLINRENCRLRDINNLILDTGLGMDSLSMISQGNIQYFAEAKPIDRRSLFEEASSVAKYKKRKIESLNKLERTQNNIERAEDIVNELEKQVSPLQRAAHKAMVYTEKRNRLQEIEVAVLVNDIAVADADLASYQQQSFDVSYQITAAQSSIDQAEKEIDEYKVQLTDLDNMITVQQGNLMNVMNDIQNLEKRKVTLDEKRKYLQKSDIEEVKIRELKNALDEAEFEYRDRQKRYDELNASIEMLAGNLDDYFNEAEKKKGEIDNSANLLSRLNNRRNILQSQYDEPFTNQAAVKAIIDNKGVLPGIYDVVSSLVKVDDGYQLAVSQSLAGAVYHIVTEDEKAAKGAIRFLKQNHVGQATFLPLNVLKAHDISQEHLFVAENTEGFLGLASDFVDCDPKFDIIVLSLLGNVLIADNLDNANEIARRLGFQYKVVTLDGDIIYRGGSFSGGYNQQVTTPLTIEQKLNEVRQQIDKAREQSDKLNGEYEELIRKYNETREDHTNKRVALASLKEVLNIKQNKYENLLAEYNSLNPQNDDTESAVDDVIRELNEAYLKKDEITNDIQNRRNKRLSINSLESRKQQQLRQFRRELSTYTSASTSIEIEMAKLNTQRDSLTERLVREYNLTYDFARQRDFSDIDITTARNDCAVLRSEIASLGNVNLDAPEEYEQINERYEFLVSQLNDLVNSKNKLLDAIDELDEVMKTQFLKTFNAIND